jgi:hypothetical protein
MGHLPLRIFSKFVEVSTKPGEVQDNGNGKTLCCYPVNPVNPVLFLLLLLLLLLLSLRLFRSVNTGHVAAAAWPPRAHNEPWRRAPA